MKKDVFVDRHKQSDVEEDYKRFLNKMKDLKPYLIEFNKNGTMKDKTYSLDCIVRNENCQQIMIITHDECTFLANDNICKDWTKFGDTFLCLKD